MELEPSFAAFVEDTVQEDRMHRGVESELGVGIRAISDEGVLVQSGPAGLFVDDIPGKSRRTLARTIDLGFRAFFRNASELVYVRDRDVRVVDLAKE